MKTEIRNIITFSELDQKWQKIAIENLDLEDAIEALYLEPRKHHKPGLHVLVDLNDALYTTKDSDFDAVIGVSNNCGLGLKFIDNGDRVIVTYV